ncbi:heparinase II/III family protein [Dongia soli]|uniref:Heparinase II/III family protein n=1 Tax=Dongia soli TaxID=600628 RepID=A0ABU5E7L6_9PROT|nr:heparinase II/III family protein [Dongia soli]MDY0881856.1 heparinase II/III family protein [Dongia soli]
MAESATSDTIQSQPRLRKGNQRPKLIAPRLQTIFALPRDMLASLAWRNLAQPVYRSRLYNWTLGKRSSGDLTISPQELWPGDEQLGLHLLGGEYRCGSEVVRNPKPLGNPIGVSLEWRRQINAFEWLDHLRACGGPAARQLARQLTQQWLEENPSYDSFAWRGDILADRLRRILLNQGFLEIQSDALFRSALLYSLNRQATHLARALPDGLAGSSLLKAAISLMIAGVMLPQGDSWLQRGRKIFAQEIGRQMLADGGHVERSPGVMLDLLQRFLDLRHVLTLARQPLPDHLQIAIENIASVVYMMCHGDGKLALFNDTSEETPELLGEALSRVGDRLRDLSQLPLTGYQRLKAGKTMVLMDCGAPPRHGLDDHAHAGTLAFEMSHGTHRIIVNCGAAHLGADDWRQVQRTTAAHSTLIVDDTNSSMLLEHGGMALRPTVVTSRREETEGQIWLDTSHNGYDESYGLIHRRRLFLAADGHELMGEDTLNGSGGNAFTLRFHLHPQVQASITQNGQAALLKIPGAGGWRMRVQGGDIALAESIYMGQRGQVRRSQQLVVLGMIDNDATQIKWALQKESNGKK